MKPALSTLCKIMTLLPIPEYCLLYDHIMLLGHILWFVALLSERADATRATGERLKEGAVINKSLVTLGTVISALGVYTSMSHYGRNR